MVSPEQADKASESLLEPSKTELAARKRKLKERKASMIRHRDSALFPAAIGAGVALFARDLAHFSNDAVPFLIGAIVGWVFGLALQRSQRAEAPGD
ncbi:MAG: hypothetical protein QNJ05_12905 [Woeseiaceae bacterium]|nr:hypothetical protein [Woeseiaceae bacterium]